MTTVVTEPGVTLLGGFEVRSESGPIPVTAGLSSGIVARLALAPGEVVPGDRLVEDLWSDPTEAALNTLRSQVSRMRQGAMGAYLSGGRAGYSLIIDPDAVDAVRLRLLAQRGELADAEALWERPLLPGFERFPFVVRERALITDLGRDAALRLAEQRVAAGDAEAAVAPLRRLIDDLPFDERPVLLLATALSRSGRSSEALAVIDALRLRLRDDQGLDLPPSSEQLRASIVRRDAAVSEVSVAEVERHGVAVPLTQLVGRREELDAIETARREARVVTLVGPGGVGKTRLAMESARRATGLGDEVQWVIELADLQDDDVLTALATAIGSPEGDLAAVCRQLGARRTLLILDNAEHMLTAVADLVRDLVARVDGLAVLVTSREALHLPGERIVPVRAWDDQLIEDAVALFVDRVRDAIPDFDPAPRELASIRAICRRVDGLPLGIELVAGLADVLDLTTLELSVAAGSPPLEVGRGTARHRSLRSVIDWSFGLLSPEEQGMLVQLSGFAGTFSLETVAGICQTDGDPRRLTAQLAQKSLVAVTVSQDGSRRYRMLESVRDYTQRLFADRDAWLRRHAEWHAARLDALRDALRGPDETTLQVALEAGRPDFHLALDTAIQAGDRELALRLGGGLAWHWFRRNVMREGREWMRRALEVPGKADPETEAWAAVGAIMFAFQSATRDEMFAVLERGRAAADGAGNEAVRELIIGYERYCDSLLRPERLPLYADYELPDMSGYAAWIQGELLSMHGQLLRSLGRPAQALETLAEAQRVCARAGYLWCQGSVAFMIAKIHLDLRKGRDAARMARRGILIAAKGPSATSALTHLETLAGACAYLERHRDGAILFGAHDAITAHYGLRYEDDMDLEEQCRREPVQQGLTADEWAEAYELGRRMSRSAALEFALSIAPAD
ncbi:MAG TPA: BTAD domain-containing putative transcriptional regulator [Rhodoglobus sp.]|nr:BTAD domain-containing putative transcriptional regulator [Rhodoglobus sp.]